MRALLSDVAHTTVHRPDPDVPIEDTVKAMDEERKAGKFKYIGLSEMGAETLERAAKTVKIDAIQVECVLDSQRS